MDNEIEPVELSNRNLGSYLCIRTLHWWHSKRGANIIYADRQRHRGAKMAGLRATTVAARRAINSRATARGPVREYLITNVDRRAV